MLFQRHSTGFVAYLLGVTLLVACASPSTDTTLTATPPQSSPPTAAPALAVARHYRIEPANSKLHVLVYRGGTMARLGHNHVVSSRNLSGSVWKGNSLDSSGFDIAVPVNDLVVDDNTARTAEGEDFPLNVSEDAKQSTKANRRLFQSQTVPVIYIFINGYSAIESKEFRYPTVWVYQWVGSNEIIVPKGIHRRPRHSTPV